MQRAMRLFVMVAAATMVAVHDSIGVHAIDFAAIEVGDTDATSTPDEIYGTMTRDVPDDDTNAVPIGMLTDDQVKRQKKEPCPLPMPGGRPKKRKTPCPLPMPGGGNPHKKTPCPLPMPGGKHEKTPCPLPMPGRGGHKPKNPYHDVKKSDFMPFDKYMHGRPGKPFDKRTKHHLRKHKHND